MSRPGVSWSLWSVVAPLPVTRDHVWPYLSDEDGIRASTVNRASLLHYSHFPILRRAFVERGGTGGSYWARDWLTEGALVRCSQLPLNNRFCWPAITRLELWSWDGLRPLLPRLPCLRHLDVRETLHSCIDGLLPASLRALRISYTFSPITGATFPPQLTALHLSDPACATHNTVPRLSPGDLPSSLLRLHYNVSGPLSTGVLPAGLRVLCVGDELVVRVSASPTALPPSLKELHYGRGCESLDVGELPASLLVVSLDNSLFRHRLDRVLSADSQLQYLWASGSCETWGVNLPEPAVIR